MLFLIGIDACLRTLKYIQYRKSRSMAGYANEGSKLRNIVFVIVFIFGFINCNFVLLDARAANFGSN